MDDVHHSVTWHDLIDVCFSFRCVPAPISHSRVFICKASMHSTNISSRVSDPILFPPFRLKPKLPPLLLPHPQPQLNRRLLCPRHLRRVQAVSLICVFIPSPCRFVVAIFVPMFTRLSCPAHELVNTMCTDRYLVTVAHTHGHRHTRHSLIWVLCARRVSMVSFSIRSVGVCTPPPTSCKCHDSLHLWLMSRARSSCSDRRPHFENSSR